MSDEGQLYRGAMVRIANEALSTQLGSVPDAIALVEDSGLEPELESMVVDYLEQKAEEC